jgi:TATA-box binding protein (TBP) (component of TFIID and TFIIIB)
MQSYNKDRGDNEIDLGKGPAVISNLVCRFWISEFVYINLRKIGLYHRKVMPLTYNEPRFVGANISMDGVMSPNEWYSDIMLDDDIRKEVENGIIADPLQNFSELIHHFKKETISKEINAYEKIIHVHIPSFPVVTFLIFSSGKVVQGGALSEFHATYAALQFSKYLNKHLDIPVRVTNFRITNIVMIIKRPFPLDLYRMKKEMSSTTVYNPKRFPAARISGIERPREKILAYRSGSVVVCGCNSMESLKIKYHEMYALSDKYRDIKTPNMSPQEYRHHGAKMLQNQNLSMVSDNLQIKSNPHALIQNPDIKKLTDAQINKNMMISLGSRMLLKQPMELLKQIDTVDDEYEDEEDEEEEDDDDTQLTNIDDDDQLYEVEMEMEDD